jgi:hypothetical protein
MSMIRCDRCSRLIDSDDDPECFVQVIDHGDDGATKDAVLCEPCREKQLRDEELPDADALL